MASDGRPPGKVLPSDLGADQAWPGGFRYPDPLGCWTEYYRLPCHLSGSVVRHHRLVRSQKTKKNIIRDVAFCVVIGIIVYVMFGYLGVNFPRALLI